MLLGRATAIRLGPGASQCVRATGGDPTALSCTTVLSKFSPCTIKRLLRCRDMCPDAVSTEPVPSREVMTGGPSGFEQAPSRQTSPAAQSAEPAHSAVHLPSIQISPPTHLQSFAACWAQA